MSRRRWKDVKEVDIPSDATIRSPRYVKPPFVINDGSSGLIDITRESRRTLQPASMAA